MNNHKKSFLFQKQIESKKLKKKVNYKIQKQMTVNAFILKTFNQLKNYKKNSITFLKFLKFLKSKKKLLNRSNLVLSQWQMIGFKLRSYFKRKSQNNQKKKKLMQ